jgi:hypothetical protein
VYLASAATGSADVQVLSFCNPAPKQNSLISGTQTSGAMQHAHNPKVSNISNCIVVFAEIRWDVQMQASTPQCDAVTAQH